MEMPVLRQNATTFTGKVDTKVVNNNLKGAADTLEIQT
jgi:hypothetical protein